MPLQINPDTGGLLMLDSGSLANECCCSVVPAVPDLTSLMRSLSEARHYVADENGINQEFGGGQGTAWPTQRTAPFLPPPPDGEDIPPDFYEGDYLADIQNAYDDLQTIIDNYNYIKNFFLKTDPAEGASSLLNYTGADDYNPGVINAGNFDAIRAQSVILINEILKVQIQGHQIVDCCKTSLSETPTVWADWPIHQACAETLIDTEECGEYSQVEGPGCIPFAVDPCAATDIQGLEETTFFSPLNNGMEASLFVISGHIDVDLTNFTSAADQGIYLLPNKADLNYDFSSFGPVPLEGVYQNWISPTLGVLYSSPTVTNSDQKLAWTFTGPTPPNGPDNVVQGSSWKIDDSVAVLTRNQIHVAS